MSTHRSRILRTDLVGAASLLAVTVGAYLLGVEPGMTARQGFQRQALTIDGKRMEATIAESNLHADQIRRSLLRKQVEELPFRLASAAAINERMVRLTQLAERSHLSVDHISPGKAEPSAMYTAVPIKLSGSCTYGSFNRFLADLRTECQDTSVVEFKLVGAPNNQGPTPTNNAAFTLDCTWYAAPVATAGASDAHAH